MSQFFYNGVELDYILTHAVEDKPELTPDGTDYLYTQRTVRVRGLINPKLQPALQGETATQTEVRIRHLLEVPRKKLLFKVNADTLIESPVGTAATDVKNGPFPRVFSITRVTGDQGFYVEMEVVTYVIECPGGAKPQYLAHRWRESVKIDETFYTTKTRSGTIWARADVTTNADALRGLVVPPLDNGFKRIGSEYVLQEDGLALQYSFTDQEQYLQPPAPAVKADGEYMESTASPGGVIRYAECRVRLEGAKGVTAKGAQGVWEQKGKADLLKLAITIAASKVRLTTDDSFLVAAAVKERLWRNEVEVSIKARIRGSKKRTSQLAAELSRFIVPPVGSEPGAPAPDVGTHGTAALQMVAAALKDPCLTQSSMRTGALAENVLVGTTLNPEARVLITKLIPDDSNALSSGDYEDFQVRYRYECNMRTLQLPIAGTGTTAGLVRTANPTMRITAEWSAVKLGSAPQIPDPGDLLDGNAVLEDFSIEPEEVELLGDGVTPIVTIKGWYRYLVRDVSQVQLRVPVPPFIAQMSGLRPTGGQSGLFATGVLNGETGGDLGDGVFDVAQQPMTVTLGGK